MRKYLLNCFLFLIPVFLWNLIFIKLLPETYSIDFFWKDIPPIIGTTENILRIIVFAVPLIMIISLETRIQKIGLLLYLVGITLYFLSWIMQIYFPESIWSISLLGFMAPAYATIIFFVGIGLIGKESFFKIPFISIIYIAISILFVVFHSIHAYIVFQRL